MKSRHSIAVERENITNQTVNFFIIKQLVISTLFVLFSFTAILGQNVMPSDYKADQVLKSNSRINPTSLAMELSIPLGGYKGRAGNGLPISFNYSSKVWQMETTLGGAFEFMSGTKTAITPLYAKRTAAGWSSNLGSPRLDFPPNIYEGDHTSSMYGGQLYQPVVCTNNCSNENYYLYYVKRVQVIMPDGSSHEFRKDDTIYSYGTMNSQGTQDMTGTFLSVDGSRMRLDITSSDATLFMPDGSRYFFPSSASHAQATSFKDRHGNTMSFNTSTRTWTDTIGRTITDPIPENWTSQTQTVGTVSAHFPGVGSDTLDVDFVWAYLKDPTTSASVIDDPDNTSQTLYYGSDYYCSNGGTIAHYYRSGEHLFNNPESSVIWVCSSQSVRFNPIVLSGINLPNGQSYQFKYNAYGEITKVIYPTGGFERFKYGTVGVVQPAGVSYDQANRGVTDRWISEKGDGTDEIHWQYDNDSWTITAPDGSHTEQLIYTESEGAPQPYGFGDAKTGRPYETRSYSTSNQLLSRTLTGYETTGAQSGGYSGATRDMRPNKEVSIIFEPGNSYALATMTETIYDTNDTTGNSDPAYFAPLNAKQSKKYNYVVVSASTAASANIATAAGWFSSSDLAVITEMDYLYDPNYKDRNINGLSTETRVKDASGNVKAKSQIFYDEVGTYPLLTDVSSSNWVDPSSNYRGLVTTTKSWTDISNNLSIQTHARYDRLGNLRYSWDGNGNLSQTEYSSTYDRAYPTKTISPIPDSAGTYGLNDELETTITYDFDTALPLTVTDPNGGVTEMEYDDPLFRSTKTIAPNDAETITEYGAGTSASTRWVKVKTQIDSTNWKEAYSWFDGLGRAYKTQSVDAATGDIFALTCYDDMGRVSKASNPFRNVSTPTCSSSLDWTTKTYDAAGRLWKVTTPDSAVVETTYSLATAGSQIGTVVTVEDQADKLRRSITNALGQLIRVDEPDGSNALGSISSPNQPTLYSYDKLNNLITVQQDGDTTGECGGASSCTQTRTFTYDALSRLKSAVNPESGTINYTYDSNGNLATKIDARNITTTYTYDRLNRPTLRAYTNEPSGSETPDVTYYYDNLTNAKGRLIKVTNGTGANTSTTEYEAFDIMGRVTQSQQTTDGTAYTAQTYAYNLSGALIEEAYPSGRVVKNILDSTGDLSIVQSKKNSNYGYWNYADNFTYTAAGAVSSMQLGNFKWESTTFNSRLQPTQIALGTTQAAYDILKLNYTYNSSGQNDNNGNILTQTITVPTVGSNTGFTAVQTYTYDSLNRIKDANENLTPNGGTTVQTWKQTFTYDRYGNRSFDESSSGGNYLTTTLTRGCSTSTYNPNGICSKKSVNPTFALTNKINQNQDGTNDYTFDSAGNTTKSADGNTYIYDAENKQIEVKNSSSQTIGQYWYDGDGKRVKKYVPGTGETTIFIYDASGLEVAEYSTIVESTSTAKVSYLTNDSLGSPRINTDQNGAVTARHDYQPFGEEISSSQRISGLGYSSDTVRKKFTGYERDDESGLDFAQARMYSKSLGRFTTTDPLYKEEKRLSDPQQINLYTYVRNNPLVLTDPTGLDFEFTGKDKKKFKNDINNREGKQFDVKLNKKGFIEVKNKGKIDVNKLSESERDFFNAINDTNTHAKVEGVDKNSQIDFGSFKEKGTNQLDAADMKLLRKADKSLAGHVVGHEMMEAYSSAKLNTSNQKLAHAAASAVFAAPTITPTNLIGVDEAGSASGVSLNYTFVRNGKSTSITVEQEFEERQTGEIASPVSNIVKVTKP